MSGKFEQVKQYVQEMDMMIVSEDVAEELVVVDDEENGIKNLIIDCEAPIVILEQVIMEVPAKNTETLFKRLLQMNRNLVHGAFVLDETGKVILFRDTLQLENLDRNELEGSVHALSLGLSEHGRELLTYMA